jgi:hypothetical protein
VIGVLELTAHDSRLTTRGGAAHHAAFALVGCGSAALGIVTPGSILDGNWHHVAGTWDGVTVRLYLDGAQAASAPLSGMGNNTRNLNIGFASGPGNNTPARFFRGSVDEVSIYGGALSASEVFAVFGAGGNGKCLWSGGVATAAMAEGSLNYLPFLGNGTVSVAVDLGTGVAQVTGTIDSTITTFQEFRLFEFFNGPLIASTSIGGPFQVQYQSFGGGQATRNQWRFATTITLTIAQVDAILSSQAWIEATGPVLNLFGRLSHVSQPTWDPSPPVLGPSARHEHTFVYDSLRKVSVLFGGSPDNISGLDDTWEWSGSGWTARPGSPRPAARWSHAACFDATRGRVVVFGGETGGPRLADTWEWDGSVWRDMTPAIGPSARSNAAMAHDSFRGVVVLFGGYDGGYLQDTWEWQGRTSDGTWVPLTITGLVPPARRNHAMVYDPRRGVVVLHGGEGVGGAILNDTWEFDGRTWFPVATPVGPGNLSEHNLAYDEEKGRVVLFGGRRSGGGANLSNETWEYNGVWSRSVTSESPPARVGQGMAYDDERKRVVAFGGATSSGQSSDETWELQTNKEPTFSGAVAPAGNQPTDVALVDLDRDGKLDVVTANEAAPEVTMLRNDGTGALTVLPLDIAGTNFAARAVVGLDADHDGQRDDLAVVGDNSQFALLLNPWDANPPTTLRTTAGVGPVHVAAGDLDADARDDVIVVCEGHLFPFGQSVEVYRNGGALSQSLALPGGVRPQRVEVCDLDGDGDRDLAVLVHAGPDALLFYCNDGTGSFGPEAGRVPLLSSGLARGLCCGDFDADGDVDFATTESSLFPAPGVSIAVLRHTGNGLQPGDFTVARRPSPGNLALDCAHGDVDADAVAGFAPRTDFVVVNGGSADVVVHYGFAAATDTFAQRGACSSNGLPVAAAVGDLNGDGTGDVVVANRGSTREVRHHRAEPDDAARCAPGDAVGGVRSAGCLRRPTRAERRAAPRRRSVRGRPRFGGATAAP